MKTTGFAVVKNAVALVAVAAVVGGLMYWSANREKAPKPVVSANPAPASPAATAQPEPAPEMPVVAESPAVAVTDAAPVKAAPKVKKMKVAKSGGGQKPSIQDPDARAALSLVGMDQDAEDYWVSAINDPALGATERQDLIEDLNEDGLSDPKHPGPEDVPVILNRLALIEELAPDAMDQVNADAFAEAHKDLVAMLNGEVVK